MTNGYQGWYMFARQGNMRAITRKQWEEKMAKKAIKGTLHEAEVGPSLKLYRVYVDNDIYTDVQGHFLEINDERVLYIMSYDDDRTMAAFRDWSYVKDITNDTN